MTPPSMRSDRLRLRRAIDAATSILAEAGVESARIDAELLAAHVTATERGLLALVDSLDPDFFQRYDEAVAARAQRIPLQHITGIAAFGSLQLSVGPGVFIPRPETESVLEWAVGQDLPGTATIVDLCTGSGALAIALACNRPYARVIGVDCDSIALGYARRNAESASAQVESATMEWMQADITQAGLFPNLVGGVDLVVANPPYIPESADLPPEVIWHDPSHALFGGADGMAVIEPIVALAARWLKPGGLFAVEHDDTTSVETVELIDRTRQFTAIAAHHDLAGRPRFVTATKAAGQEAG